MLSKTETESAIANYQAARDQSLKADAGKLEMSIVPYDIMKDVAEVRMFGKSKYGAEPTWKDVELQRYLDALLRHTLAFIEDLDSVDSESGLTHFKHAAWNMATISWLLHNGKRPPIKEKTGGVEDGSNRTTTDCWQRITVNSTQCLELIERGICTYSQTRARCIGCKCLFRANGEVQQGQIYTRSREVSD